MKGLGDKARVSTRCKQRVKIGCKSTLVGAIQTGMGGGNAGYGAIAAGSGEKLNTTIAEYLDQQYPSLSAAEKKNLQQLTGLVIGATAVKLAGGDTTAVQGGAVTALQGESFNRQLHESEIKRIKELARDYAAKYGLSTTEAETQLMAQALRDVDKTYHDDHAQENLNAENFLRANATTFVDEQGRKMLMFANMGYYNDPTLYANTRQTYATEYAAAERGYFSQFDRNKQINDTTHGLSKLGPLAVGAGKGAGAAAYEFFAPIPDLLQVGYGTAQTAITGAPYDLTCFSSVCTAAQQGATYEQISRGGFHYLMDTPNRLIDAYQQGNYDQAGFEGGSLLPAAAVALEGGRVNANVRAPVVAEETTLRNARVNVVPETTATNLAEATQKPFSLAPFELELPGPGSLKNASGNLDMAANAARNQPYGPTPATSPKITDAPDIAVPLKNPSGNLDVAANAARNQPYGLPPSGKDWNPLTGPGPLGEHVANTFRGATYAELTTTETTTLYRVWGGSAGEIGPYWTRTPPSGPMQSIIDSALNPAWGNTAANVTRIQVPAGVRIYEGVAASQNGLVGGGNQVFIPKVNPEWVVK